MTPLVVSAIGAPLPVMGSDGMQHIDYDLLIANVFSKPVTLTSVEALDPTGEVILEIAGDDLASVTESNFLQQPVNPAAQVQVSQQVSVEIDVTVAADSQAPSSLTHRVAWSVDATAPGLAFLDGNATGTLMTLPLQVSDIVATQISAPLSGPGWWSFNGCCKPNAHRSLRYAIDGANEIKPEMFAVDWLQLDNGAIFTGEGSAVADYPYAGSNVLAVADGVVVASRDDMPNEIPMQPPVHVKQGRDYIGNSVVIQIAENRYAIYGHLEPGSVIPKVGDRVTTGDVIASLGNSGNSGNSTAPHLHFVVTDNPDFLVATSIPFAIDTWTLQGTAVAPDGPGTITIAGDHGEQSHTHPIWQSVATFR